MLDRGQWDHQKARSFYDEIMFFFLNDPFLHGKYDVAMLSFFLFLLPPTYNIC